MLGSAAGVGLLAAAVLVAAAGRAPTPLGMMLPPAFAGVLRPASSGGTAATVVVVLALACLVGCWWSVLQAAGRGAVGLRPVAWTAVLWSLPVLAAPPLLSLDAYSYLAQGSMLAAGLDPYAGGPVLQGGTAAERTDPMWRASPVPYGPLTLVVLRSLAVVSSDLMTGVLLLRAVALLGVIAAVAVALHLAPRDRRPYVLALTALNPITLVHLVGGVHVDGVLAGVVALCLLAVSTRRWWSAWALAAVAVAVKVTVAPLLPFVALGLVRKRFRAWQVLAALGLLVGPLVVALPVVDRPWGFVAALAVPGSAAPWYAPANVLGHLLVGADRLVGLPVEPDLLRATARLAVLGAGAVAVLALLRAELRTRAVGQSSDTVRRVCLALLIVPLSLPSLYGWYLAPALFGLAAVGSRRDIRAVVVLSSGLTFTSLPPLFDVNPWVLAVAWVVSIGGLALRWRWGSTDPGAAHLAPPSLARAGHHPVWSRTARLSGAALAVPLSVGLLSPGVSAQGQAPSTALPPRLVADRIDVVEQLKRDYPRLLIVRVGSPGEDQIVRVTLVDPGRGSCTLRLVRRTGTYAKPYERLLDGPGDRAIRALDENTCPTPAVH